MNGELVQNPGSRNEFRELALAMALLALLLLTVI